MQMNERNYMVHLLLGVLLCWIATVTAASKWQSIHGRVIAKHNKVPLFDCTVTITGFKPSDETPQDLNLSMAGLVIDQVAALTDLKGEFSIENLPAGYYDLTISHGLCNDYHVSGIKISERIINGRRLMILLECPYELDGRYREQVTVTARIDEMINDEPVVSSLIINPENIDRTAGSFGDVTRTIQTFPGVVSSGDFSSIMYIRGGDVDETALMLNRMPLFNPYHLGGFITIFNTELIDKVDFYSGAFPPQYPPVLSGVIDVTYRNGSLYRFKGRADISFISADLTLEGPLFDRKGSYIIGARRSYIDYFLKYYSKDNKDIMVPYYGDYLARFSLGSKGDHELIFEVLTAKDGLKIEEYTDPNQPDEKPGKVFFEDRRNYANLIWKWIPATTTYLQSSFSYSTEDTKGSVSGTDPYGVALNFDLAHISIDYNILPRNHHIKLGIQSGYYMLDLQSLINDFRTHIPGSENWGNENFDKIEVPRDLDAMEHGFFIQDNCSLLNKKVSLIYGFRADYWGETKEFILSPRINMKYDLGYPGTISAGWGIYREFPMNILQTAQGFGNPNLGSQEAIHYVLGWERKLLADHVVRIEGYYKHMDELIVNPDNEEDLIQAVADGKPFQNAGNGYAYGLELFWQKRPSKWFDGWLSYSYGYTRRHNPLNNTELTGNPKWYYPRQDQRHTLCAVMNFDLGRKWMLSAKYQYHTGKPYTPVVGWHLEENSGEQGGIEWVSDYGAINSARTPTYSCLDVKLAKQWVYPRMVVGAYIDILNVLNQRNIYGWDYDAGDPQEGIEPKKETIYNLPIIPMLGGWIRF